MWIIKSIKIIEKQPVQFIRRGVRITKGILETRINTGFSQEKVLFDSIMITLAEKYLFTFRWRLLGESQLKLIEKVLLNWRENQFGKTFLLAYVN